MDTGYWILDRGRAEVCGGIGDGGYWVLDTGYWIVDRGYWLQEIG